MSAAERISLAVDRVDWGIVVAWQRGRTAHRPYVAVLKYADGRTEQILARAFRTADEALALGEGVIRARRERLELDLRRPNYRALREFHGLPRELAELELEG